MSSKSCNVSFSGQHLTSFATFVTSSAEKVIVYFDKLDEARFNEHNTGVTFVSRGDTIKVEGRRRRRGGENPLKQTDFSYCHMPLLNNQISHPPRNRGCTESHYLLWLRGERQHFFCDFHGTGRRGEGLAAQRCGDRVLLICTYMATPPYRYVNDPGMNSNAKVYTISFPLHDLHMGPLGG